MSYRQDFLIYYICIGVYTQTHIYFSYLNSKKYFDQAKIPTLHGDLGWGGGGRKKEEELYLPCNRVKNMKLDCFLKGSLSKHNNNC